MHSIPLGPSEKNSFCAKGQRSRDMCDPYGKKPNFWPSQRLKKVLLTAQGCARLRKAAQGCARLGKAAQGCAGLRKAAQGCARLRKAVQGCARLRTGPIIMQIPRGYQKKSLLCRKARYVQSLGKKHFWPSQRLKKLTGALSCMHKGPKCIPSLWDHVKKISIVQKHKESVICAILREKTPFWGLPRG